jgi:hypothetical protein
VSEPGATLGAVSPVPVSGLLPAPLGAVLPVSDVDGVGLELGDGDVGELGDGEVGELGDDEAGEEDSGTIVGGVDGQLVWFGAPEVWFGPPDEDRDPEFAWDWPGAPLLPPARALPPSPDDCGPVAAWGETY